MIKDARVGCCCHNSTSTKLHSAGGRVAGWWPATVVVGADSVSGPSGSLGLRTPPSCSSAQCPKSFSMGEQRSPFTGNSQLEADRKETSFGKTKTVSAFQPFHVKELRWQKGCHSLRKSLSFAKLRRICLQPSKPNPHFPSAPDRNIERNKNGVHLSNVRNGCTVLEPCKFVFATRQPKVQFSLYLNYV